MRTDFTCQLPAVPFKKCIVIVISLFAFGGFVAGSVDHIDEKPIIVTGLGKIQGSVLKSRLGVLFYGFRGIRYAKAPVGDLRFKVSALICGFSIYIYIYRMDDRFEAQVQVQVLKSEVVFRHPNRSNSGPMCWTPHRMDRCVHNPISTRLMCLRTAYAWTYIAIM